MSPLAWATPSHNSQDRAADSRLGDADLLYWSPTFRGQTDCGADVGFEVKMLLMLCNPERGKLLLWRFGHFRMDHVKRLV
jgi:hypothetical protein